jgi:hypothetical protein
MVCVTDFACIQIQDWRLPLLIADSRFNAFSHSDTSSLRDRKRYRETVIRMSTPQQVLRLLGDTIICSYAELPLPFVTAALCRRTRTAPTIATVTDAAAESTASPDKRSCSETDSECHPDANICAVTHSLGQHVLFDINILPLISSYLCEPLYAHTPFPRRGGSDSESDSEFGPFSSQSASSCYTLSTIAFRIVTRIDDADLAVASLVLLYTQWSSRRRTINRIDFDEHLNVDLKLHLRHCTTVLRAAAKLPCIEHVSFVEAQLSPEHSSNQSSSDDCDQKTVSDSDAYTAFFDALASASITSLDLSYCTMPTDAACEFVRQLPRFNLTSLCLDGFNDEMHSRTLKCLYVALPLATTLRSLGLCMTGLGSRSIVELADVLPQCYLTGLDIGANTFNRHVCSQLAKCFANATCSISHLRLGAAYFVDPEGTRELLEACMHRLTCLDIAEAGLNGGCDVQALADALSTTDPQLVIPLQQLYMHSLEDLPSLENLTIAKALVKCTAPLRRLSMWIRPVYSSDDIEAEPQIFRALANAFRNSDNGPNLWELEYFSFACFHSSHASDDWQASALEFCSALSHSKTLKTLALSFRDDSTIKFVSEELKNAKHGGDDGVSTKIVIAQRPLLVLFKCMPPALEVLDLISMSLDNTNSRALAHMIISGYHPRLRSIGCTFDSSVSSSTIEFVTAAAHRQRIHLEAARDSHP